MRNTIIIAAALGTMLAGAPAGAQDGKAIYDTRCVACHTPGVGGAPKIGDTEAWVERVAKGMDTLYENSINGFDGDAAAPMPAKGGFPDLSDAEIKAAVDYMVEQSQ